MSSETNKSKKHNSYLYDTTDTDRYPKTIYQLPTWVKNHPEYDKNVLLDILGPDGQMSINRTIFQPDSEGNFAIGYEFYTTTDENDHIFQSLKDEHPYNCDSVQRVSGFVNQTILIYDKLEICGQGRLGNCYKYNDFEIGEVYAVNDSLNYPDNDLDLYFLVIHTSPTEIDLAFFSSAQLITLKSG